jgi:hypothetical protein
MLSVTPYMLRCEALKAGADLGDRLRCARRNDRIRADCRGAAAVGGLVKGL